MSDIDPVIHGDDYAGLGHNRPVQGDHQQWEVARITRSLRVGLVEPAHYRPEAHAELFGSLVSTILRPNITELDPGGARLREPVDLLTWPEAFLPAPSLVELLTFLIDQDSCPCVHVGLRPDATNDTHLFSHTRLQTLVVELRALSPTIHEDLAKFAGWLEGASPAGFYNVAAVFMVDAQHRLRVALHPKNTPAAVEISALAEHNLTQADFTLVVSLVPVGPGGAYRVNIQPLICSDFLDLQRDTHRLGPMAVLASSPEQVGPHAPEHIDLVSIAACTPQKNEAFPGSPERLAWQPRFREMLVSLMDSAAYGRHRDALVLLANPRRIGEKPAGLTGCFAPLPLPQPPQFDERTRIWSFGRLGNGDNRWAPLHESEASKSAWSSLAHLVAVNPDQLSDPGGDYLFVFTIPSFPRDRTRRDASPAISGVELHALGSVTVGADGFEADPADAK